ncbi:MAG: hypothetical protein AB7O37_04925 [Vicinamibacteria bacterium]
MVARTLASLGLAALLGCAGAESGPPAPAAAPPPSRSFAMGFTDFPHAFSSEAIAFAMSVVERDGDLAIAHWDDGVPWQEALSGATYAPGFQAEIARRQAGFPPGHVLYLALTPIAFERDRLAAHKGDTGGEPLRPPWNARSFDHPEVIAAFLAHCERMLAAFRPRYFAYAIEANLLARIEPREWPAFVSLAAAIYPRLKATHPELPIFLTLQADTFHEQREIQADLVRQVLPFTDVIAVSSYPFSAEADPERLRADHFSALRELAPAKPFAVSETCWPAEPVSAPYPAFIPASEQAQRRYVERLLGDAERLDAVFVSWFFPRDFDDFWDSHIRLLPNAPLLRLWKDCGLYAGDGRERPGLGVWRDWLARRRAG